MPAVNLSALSRKFQVSRQTVHKWKDQNAPIHDEKLLRKWLAGRKHIAPGVRRSLPHFEAEAKKRLATSTGGASPRPVEKIPQPDQSKSRDQAAKARKPKPATIAAGIAGAGQALKRLESAELAAFDRMQAALDAGEDAVTVADLRKSWLSISESLRKFDLLVEQNRREAGELIPKEIFEKCINNFLQGVWISFRLLQSGTVNRVLGAKEAWEIGKVFDELLGSAWIAGALGMMPLDPALAGTIKKKITEHFKLTDEQLEAKKRAVDTVLAHFKMTSAE